MLDSRSQDLLALRNRQYRLSRNSLNAPFLPSHPGGHHATLCSCEFDSLGYGVGEESGQSVLLRLPYSRSIYSPRGPTMTLHVVGFLTRVSTDMQVVSAPALWEQGFINPEALLRPPPVSADTLSHLGHLFPVFTYLSSSGTPSPAAPCPGPSVLQRAVFPHPDMTRVTTIAAPYYNGACAGPPPSSRGRAAAVSDCSQPHPWRLAWCSTVEAKQKSLPIPLSRIRGKWNWDFKKSRCRRLN